MTTSEPRTPHDDTPREDRRLGQRILDAVLGDPADTRPDDPADPRRADPDRAEGGRRGAEGGAEGFAGDGPRGGYSSYEQATRDHPVGGTVRDDRAAGQGHLAPDPDVGDRPTDALHGVSRTGPAHRDDALRAAGYDAGDTVSDGRRDAGDRVPTEPVDRDRDDTHRGVGAAAGAAGAGAVAGAALRDDRSGTDRDLGRDTRFSALDDTATVDGTDTGRTTAEAATAGDGRVAAGVADEDGESGTRERLVPAERADDYGSRWDALKGDFVDEPRRAVQQADELVGELLDELQRLFADQRRNLEQGFDHDRASTEDLRLALRRYRSFFDRLLSF